MFKSIDTYSVSELKEEAKFLGLKGYSKLRKSELVERIKQKSNNSTSPSNTPVKIKNNVRSYVTPYIPKNKSHPLDAWFEKIKNKNEKLKIVKN